MAQVHVTLFQDPIEVPDDEVEVLRVQGLLREDPQPAPEAAPAPAPAVDQPAAPAPAAPTPAAAPAKLTKEKGA